MIPTMLELFACLIAAVSGFLGLWFGELYVVIASGLLLMNVYAYLNTWATAFDNAQKGKTVKWQNLICQVLHKMIYVIFAVQIILLGM